MLELLAAHTYRNVGFPINVESTDKSTLAVITYPSWGAGFFVVDIDAHNGGLKTYEELQKTIDFPETVTARTQRGGLHLYFKYPDGYLIPSSINQAIGIDILGDDSMVHMPPTKGAITEHRYSWIHSPQEFAMADPTPSLLTFIKAQKHESTY